MPDSSVSREPPPLPPPLAVPRDRHQSCGRSVPSLPASSKATAPRRRRTPGTPPSAARKPHSDRSSDQTWNCPWVGFKKEIESNLREEDDGAEEGGADVGAADVRGFVAYGSLVLDDPEGKVDGNALVPEEVDALFPGVGLEEVPEISADSHRQRWRRRRGEEDGNGKDFRPGLAPRWDGTGFAMRLARREP